MTFLEMHTLFDVLMDKSGRPWFNASEKDLFFNLAQNEWVKTRYKEFEVNEKRREELSPLVRSITFGAVTDINVSTVTDFMFVLAMEITYTYTNVCAGTSQPRTTYAKPMQLDDFYKVKDNAILKPSQRYPVYIEYATSPSARILQIHGTTPTAVRMFYLKTPAAINGTSAGTQNNSPDLPVWAHEEIVNVAVRKALENVESPRYQTQMMEIQKEE
jgi:hypothetical protein